MYHECCGTINSFTMQVRMQLTSSDEDLLADLLGISYDAAKISQLVQLKLRREENP